MATKDWAEHTVCIYLFHFSLLSLLISSRSALIWSSSFPFLCFHVTETKINISGKMKRSKNTKHRKPKRNEKEFKKEHNGCILGNESPDMVLQKKTNKPKKHNKVRETETISTYCNTRKLQIQSVFEYSWAVWASCAGWHYGFMHFLWGAFETIAAVTH